MKDQIKNFIKESMWVVIAIFFIHYLISKPTSMYSFIDCAGESITLAIIIMGIYEKWLWKYLPFEKTPKLYKKYYGIIEYHYNGKDGEKSTDIEVKQSLLSVSIKITTDEISSNSICSKFVYEHGEYILYYTYITNPKSKNSEINPIQYGTCRIVLNTKNNLEGTYWTSRKTIGDIYFTSDKANISECKKSLTIN